MSTSSLFVAGLWRYPVKTEPTRARGDIQGRGVPPRRWSMSLTAAWDMPPYLRRHRAGDDPITHGIAGGRVLVQHLAGERPQAGLPATQRLELVSAVPLRNGAVAMHHRRAL